MSPLLTAQGLSYSRRKTGLWLLRDIFLQINPGEQVVIYGGSGSGKTMLAALLSGVTKCRCGRVDRNGSISLMTQEFNLYNDLTVLENLEFFRAINDVSVTDLELILNQLNLADWSKTRAAKLPAGKKKMLQLACALGRPFELLILDEPEVGLDTDQNRQLWRLLEGLNQGGKATLVLTASETGLTFGDRSYRLEAGTLIPVDCERQFFNKRTSEVKEVSAVAPA